MLNYLWSGMLAAGLIWAAVFGRLGAVTQALLDSTREAVELGIGMLGVMAFWCGILEIGRRAGLIDWFTARMEPILDFLFPELGRRHPARQPIAVNMIANILGLGMAATPAGLEAMKQLAADAKVLEDGKSIATDSMCTFLILNISSLQLVPINMIAYRSQYGSIDAQAVIGPALLATFCSTAAAVLFCKLVHAKKAVRRR